MPPKIVKLPHLQAANVVDPFKAPIPTPRRVQASASDLASLWREPEPFVPASVDAILGDLWEGGGSPLNDYTAEDTFAVEFDNYEEVDRSNRYRVDQVSAREISIPRPLRVPPVRDQYVVREIRQVRPVLTRTEKPVPSTPTRTPMERARDYVEGESEFASLLTD